MTYESWKLKLESWKVKVESWKLNVESWKLKASKSNLGVEKARNSSRVVRFDLQATDRWLQQKITDDFQQQIADDSRLDAVSLGSSIFGFTWLGWRDSSKSQWLKSPVQGCVLCHALCESCWFLFVVVVWVSVNLWLWVSDFVCVWSCGAWWWCVCVCVCLSLVSFFFFATRSSIRIGSGLQF